MRQLILNFQTGKCIGRTEWNRVPNSNTELVLKKSLSSKAITAKEV